MNSSGARILIESLRQGLSVRNLEKLQEHAYAAASERPDLTVACTVLGLAFEVWWGRWHEEPLSSQRLKKIEDRLIPAAERVFREPNDPGALSELTRVVLWTLAEEQDPIVEIGSP